MAQKTTHKVMS